MSLTVSCRDCVHPTNKRQIVQWRWGNCSDCCTDFISRHLLEHPEHRLEVTGTVCDTPFGDVRSVPERVSRLLGDRRRTA